MQRRLRRRPRRVERNDWQWGMLLAMGIRALFFDLDGTLVDSEEHHWAAWRDTLTGLGLDLPWQKYLTEAIGHSDGEIFSRLAHETPAVFSGTSAGEVLEEKRARFVARVRGAGHSLSAPVLDLL